MADQIGLTNEPFAALSVLPKVIVMRDEATYICNSCGEQIVIPIDLSQGSSQEYVEDCPVCCRPTVVHVEIDEDGEARAWSDVEHDE